MLRDRDIFIIQYTLDYIHNHRPPLPRPPQAPIPPENERKGPPDPFLFLWPRLPGEEEIMLDGIDLALENSPFGDGPGNRQPNTIPRDRFLIRATSDYLVSQHGQLYEIASNEEVPILNLLAREFAHHKTVSTKYPQGEPLMGRVQFGSVEAKIPATDGTKNAMTRIYARSV